MLNNTTNFWRHASVSSYTKAQRPGVSPLLTSNISLVYSLLFHKSNFYGKKFLRKRQNVEGLTSKSRIMIHFRKDMDSGAILEERSCQNTRYRVFYGKQKIFRTKIFGRSLCMYKEACKRKGLAGNEN
uniref:Ribosomal protein S14 n=1 Tax=Romanomermis culicivorax TaxID=13658 RepID=A0A915HKJ9_ROMCU